MANFGIDNVKDKMKDKKVNPHSGPYSQDNSSQVILRRGNQFSSSANNVTTCIVWMFSCRMTMRVKSLGPLGHSATSETGCDLKIA